MVCFLLFFFLKKLFLIFIYFENFSLFIGLLATAYWIGMGLNPLIWMILSGASIYIAYIPPGLFFFFKKIKTLKKITKKN